MSCMCCLYILDINPLSVALFANIFSNSEGCLFVLGEKRSAIQMPSTYYWQLRKTGTCIYMKDDFGKYKTSLNLTLSVKVVKFLLYFTHKVWMCFYYFEWSVEILLFFGSLYSPHSNNISILYYLFYNHMSST